tara:strand:+ start:4447 stop:6105 length:1659 start_codon:yes stop_codon:yes gene_type:complete
MANEYIINNNLRVTGSISSTGGFIGDGSNLTGLTSDAEWDGSRAGNAVISGSLTVSGSIVSTVVDFQNTARVRARLVSGSFEGNGNALTDLNLNGYQSSGSNSSGSFSGSFEGDGSGLTGLGSFPYTGTAQISGSLIVSGGLVDLTGTTAISGSSFSGSFHGDGSSLTGIISEWDGTRDGNAEISGSFIVSGSSPTIKLFGETTIDTDIVIGNKGNTDGSIGIGSAGLPESTYNRCSITIGDEAGKYLISGSRNTFIGHNAGKNSICVSDNVGIGTDALCYNYGYDFGNETRCAGNTAIGSCAMKSANNARENVAVGKGALAGAGNTVGATAIGYCASLFGGLYSIAVGYKAAVTNQGSDYVAIGRCALRETQYKAVGIGTKALHNNLNGLNNVAIGYQAGMCVDNESHNNVLLGYKAGPGALTQIQNKLYIANTNTTPPLIEGDFATRQVNIHEGQISASIFSGSFVGDGSGLSGLSGTGFPFNGDAIITGSLLVTQSNAATTSITIEGGHVVLTQVSQSLDFINDTLAAAGGVPKGGLYRNGNFIQIRLN